MEIKNNTKQKEWAIYVLVHTNFGVSGHVKYMIEDIYNAGQSDEACIFLCINATEKAFRVISNKIDENNVKDPSNDTDYYTKFYEITPSGYFKKSAFQEIPSPDSFDIYSSVDLAKFFGLSVFSMSKKKMLITWDHGNAIGIFKDKKNRAGGEEISNIKLLSANDLCLAIKLYAGNNSFDILLMMNCYMNFFDFGYSLKDSIKYLIAPQSYIYWSSYNYTKIFHLLFNRPFINSKELAKKIVDFQDEVRPKTAYNLGHVIDNSTELLLLCCDLGYYENLAKNIDLLTAIIIELIENNVINQSDIANITERSNYSNEKIMLMDFSSFISALLNYILSSYRNLKLDNHPIVFICRDLLNQLYGCRINQFIGKSKFGKYAVHDSLLSFSIYLPLKLEITKGETFYSVFINETSPYATEFSKNHSWDNLVMLLQTKSTKYS